MPTMMSFVERDGRKWIVDGVLGVHVDDFIGAGEKSSAWQIWKATMMEAFQPSGAAFVDFQGAFGVDHGLLQTT